MALLSDDHRFKVMHFFFIHILEVNYVVPVASTVRNLSSILDDYSEEVTLARAAALKGSLPRPRAPPAARGS
jgi:hypothetical protein